MLRTLSIAAATVLGLAILGGLILRLGLGWLVASDEFRVRFNELLEEGIRTLLPTAMTEIRELQLNGLVDLDILDLTVRSSKAIATAVALPRVHVSPQLLSVIEPGPLRLSLDATVAECGRLVMGAAVPKARATFGLFGAVGDQPLALDGTFTKVDFAKVASLVFPGHAGPNFQLTQAVGDGSFRLVKPFTGRGSHKSGELKVHVGDSTWQLPTAGDKALTLPPVDADLQLAGFTVSLRTPLTLRERGGETAVTGALLLPARLDLAARWDLGFDVAGDTGLARSLAKLFRCNLPESDLTSTGAPLHVTVKGPITGPTCVSSR